MCIHIAYTNPAHLAQLLYELHSQVMSDSIVRCSCLLCHLNELKLSRVDFMVPSIRATHSFHNNVLYCLICLIYSANEMWWLPIWVYSLCFILPVAMRSFDKLWISCFGFHSKIVKMLPVANVELNKTRWLYSCLYGYHFNFITVKMKEISYPRGMI